MKNIKYLGLLIALLVGSVSCSTIITDPKDVQIFDYAKAGDLAGVKKCIENGASINRKNIDGSTALILASENGHLEVVTYLVEKGADIDLKDSVGSTALTLAS